MVQTFVCAGGLYAIETKGSACYPKCRHSGRCTWREKSWKDLDPRVDARHALDVFRYPLPRALFQRRSFQTQSDARCILSALLWFKVGIDKVIHRVIIADLSHLSATETTSTTWTSCDQPAHILLCGNSALSAECLLWSSPTQVMI